MKYIKFTVLFIFLFSFDVCSEELPSCVYWEELDQVSDDYFYDNNVDTSSACASAKGSSCACGQSTGAAGYYRCYYIDSIAQYYVTCQDCVDVEPDSVCDGGDCPDADEDGTPDACDDCPDDPAVQTLDEYRYYLDSACDGVYDGMTTGEYCGSCSETCSGGDQECSGSKDNIAVTSMGIGCCSNFGPTTPPPCELDENCERESDCECPDGANACDECECTCPDGSDSCEECQKPDCECGEGILHCEECQGGGGPDDPYEPGDPDPNEPGQPAEIPDEVQIGECIISLVEFKQWIVSDESFPFNFVYVIYSVLSPLYSISPSPPNFSIDLSPDSSGIAMAFNIDFEPYDIYASFIRGILSFGIVLSFVFYGIQRYANLSGVVRF